MLDATHSAPTLRIRLAAAHATVTAAQLDQLSRAKAASLLQMLGASPNTAIDLLNGLAMQDAHCEEREPASLAFLRASEPQLHKAILAIEVVS